MFDDLETTCLKYHVYGETPRKYEWHERRRLVRAQDDVFCRFGHLLTPVRDFSTTFKSVSAYISRDNCAIGGPGEWPRGLQDTVTFLLSMSHPSAIFIGDDLVLLHNKAWGGMLGLSLQQGKSQNEKMLSDQTVKILRSAIDGHYEGSLAAVDFAQQPRMDVEDSPILCSPIRFGDLKSVVVQVLCQETGEDVQEKDTDAENTDEDMALERQPFFQKFAEMLPTGLAILDHEAEALFVNRSFHKLTVHGGLDKSFKKWPQTIHPDDYERVMKAYREAFEARSDLSTEFRAYGMNSPWR